MGLKHQTNQGSDHPMVQIGLDQIVMGHGLIDRKEIEFPNPSTDVTDTAFTTTIKFILLYHITAIFELN
jgi:hypothetical protein